MSTTDKHEYDEQLLTRYLLGSLSGPETERLDELSIADDEFAWHLAAVENDLVDVYVRGEMSGDSLEQFTKFYLSTPKRLEKLQFAKTLLRLNEESSAEAVWAVPQTPPKRKPSSERTASGWFRVPRLGLQWGFAGAAFVMLFVAGYLFQENQRLRGQETEVRSQQAALDQRTQELERQLGDQRSANAGMMEELERLRESLPGPRALNIVAALLLPQTRGAGRLATVSLAKGTDQVDLRLQLESDEFPVYRVALKDPATNQMIWRSTKLKAKPEGEAKAVSITLPAGLLKQQNYILELNGVSASGTAEFLSSYPIKFVLE